MAEPSGLPSMGSHRVGHDWSDLAAYDKKKLKFVNFEKLDTISFHIIILPIVSILLLIYP